MLAAVTASAFLKTGVAQALLSGAFVTWEKPANGGPEACFKGLTSLLQGGVHLATAGSMAAQS